MKTRSVLAGVLALVCVAADGRREDATKRDLNRIQGTWAFVVIEEAGVKKSQRELKGMEDRLHWIFQGNTLIRNLGGEAAKGKFKLDARQQPEQIDLFDYAGKGKTVRGIYAFEHEQLRIFLGSAKGERPGSFGPPQPGQVYFLMKRHVVVNKDS